MNRDGQVYFDHLERVPEEDRVRLELAKREQEDANRKLLAEILATENDDG